MKKLFLSMALMAALMSAGQQKKTLVADETWLRQTKAGTITLITSNDSINKLIVRHLGKLFKRVVSAQKQDGRKGDLYWEYSYYFAVENAGKVDAFLHKL